MSNWPTTEKKIRETKHGIILELNEDGINYLDTLSLVHTLSHENFNITLKNKPDKIIENAISLLGIHCNEWYHFIAEYAWELYLQNISEEDIKKCKIILTESNRPCKSDFQKEWIKILFPFIGEDNFILLERGVKLGCIKLLPVGRFCNNVIYQSPTDLNCVRSAIIKNLNLFNADKNSLLLIKRNYVRILKNWEDVYKICKKYCEEYNLKLDVFDDSKDLGDVTSQLKKFNSAKIVLGCHGAGFTNIISCNEETHFIEFKSLELRTNTGQPDPPCFEMLAKKLGLKYNALDKTDAIGVDIKKLSDILFNTIKE